jgi:rod shape-determining protein MreD
MKNVLEAAAGILIAVILTAFFSRASAFLVPVVNVFSWVVIYFAMEKGELAGILLGTVCGLLQDALSLGVVGVAGLSKTLLGYLAGFISRKINVAPFGRNILFLFIISSLELGLWLGLMTFVSSRKLFSAGGAFLLQPFITALAVGSIFKLSRKWKREAS